MKRDDAAWMPWLTPALEHAIARETPMASDVPEERERVVQRESGAELPARNSCVGIDGPREGERPHQVRRDSKQTSSLGARLEDEVKMAVLEVADAAVH